MSAAFGRNSDPNHRWNDLQSGYTMAAFRRDVKAAMEVQVHQKTNTPQETAKPAQTEGGSQGNTAQTAVGRSRSPTEA